LVLSGKTDYFLAIIYDSSTTRWFVENLISCQFFFLYRAAVDGWAARRFNQVTKFGAWFDVIIDNIGRGILWTRISSVKKKFRFFESNKIVDKLDRNSDFIS
jgi:phosphatidylglycerophosphate synthase